MGRVGLVGRTATYSSGTRGPRRFDAARHLSTDPTYQAYQAYLTHQADAEFR
jgi:hypothetical protein